MDSIKMEKLQAMKHYNKTHFLQTLIQYSITAFVLGLFFFKGFPSLYSSLKLFFFAFLRPKCLFVVCNMIVIYLVSESKLVGSSESASPAPSIYDEYVKQSRNYRKFSTVEGVEKGKKLVVGLEEENEEVIKEALVEEKEENEEEEEEEEKEEEEEEVGLEENEEEEKEEEEENEEEEEEVGLPTVELNKRVEDFIAKVNKQRRLEARMLVFGG